MKSSAQLSRPLTFEGSEQLRSIGASFFVSYLFHLQIDRSHRNWESIATKKSRISTLKHSTQHHRAWLERIELMSDASLSRNTLGLDGASVKAMARAILNRQM